MNKLMVGLFILFIANIGFSQNLNSPKIYSAYINNDMELWKSVIDKMEGEKTFQIEYIIELVNLQYGYIGLCLENNNKKEAKRYLKSAEENLDFLKKKNWNNSMINSYESAFYAFKIGLNPIMAPFIGPKSMKHAEKALTEDNRNPFAHLMMGKNYYYMPAAFGGSKTKANDHFLQAMQLYEETKNLEFNWNYLSLLVTIAQTHEELNDHKTAQLLYSKIIEFEPEFLSVKNKINPNIENKSSLKK